MKDEPVYAQPKPRPRAFEQDEKRAARETLDRKESAKARTRAGGRCEVWVRMSSSTDMPCDRKDTQTHHMISGIGRRARGASLLAINKLRCCTRCHQQITNRVLVPVDPKATAVTVVYRRVR